MKTQTKVETCSSCNGDGWINATKGGYYPSDFIYDAQDRKTVVGKEGCTTCGGSGSRIDYGREGTKGTLKKGSGKVKCTFTTSESTCSECNGSGKARYFKSMDIHKQTPPFGGFKNQREEEKWLKKNTALKKCQSCNGSGKIIDRNIIKQEPDGCFLSTACVHYKGLKDDCSHLEILRGFRDNYVLNKYLGKEKIQLYNNISPTIVSEILNSKYKETYLNDIYLEIERAVEEINSNNNEVALNIYEKMFYLLVKEFNISIVNFDKKGGE